MRPGAALASPAAGPRLEALDGRGWRSLALRHESSVSQPPAARCQLQPQLAHWHCQRIRVFLATRCVCVFFKSFDASRSCHSRGGSCGGSSTFPSRCRTVWTMASGSSRSWASTLGRTLHFNFLAMMRRTRDRDTNNYCRLTVPLLKLFINNIKCRRALADIYMFI